MSLTFYMDENIDGRITRGLRRCGVDMLTAQEDGFDATDDLLIVDRALEFNRVIFTMGDDYVAESHNRQSLGIDFAGIIYVKMKTISIGKCINDLEYYAKVYGPDDVRNQVYYLPL